MCRRLRLVPLHQEIHDRFGPVVTRIPGPFTHRITEARPHGEACFRHDAIARWLYIAGATGGPQFPRPGEQLYRHFNDYVRELAGIIYGRHMYELMRYWDDDQPDWDAVERDFAAAWRA